MDQHNFSRTIGLAIMEFVENKLMESEDCKPETKELLSECLGGVACGVARICEDNQASHAYQSFGGRLVIFATPTHNMGALYDRFPEILSDLPEDVKHADLWGLIASCTDDNEPKIAFSALAHRLKAAGMELVERDSKMLADKGMMPAIVVLARTEKGRSAGMCMVVPLPIMGDKPTAH